MKFFFRLLFTILCITLSISSQATATVTVSSSSTVNDPQINQWLDNAQTYWQRSPHCEEKGIVVNTSALGPNAVGNATTPGCEIRLSTSWYPNPPEGISHVRWEWQMCVIIAHEYGHLLGEEHSEDVTSIMYKAPSINIPGCVDKAATEITGTNTIVIVPSPITAPVTTSAPASQPATAPKIKLIIHNTASTSSTAWMISSTVRNPSDTVIQHLRFCQQAPSKIVSEFETVAGQQHCVTYRLGAHQQRHFYHRFLRKRGTDWRMIIAASSSQIRPVTVGVWAPAYKRST